MAERYLEAVNDPTLISLRDEMALVSVRVGELVEAVGKTGNIRLWRQARAKFDLFKSSAGKGKGAVGQARAVLQELDDTLLEGLKDAATWEELRETLELQRRLTDSETKRERDLRQLITLPQAMSMIGVLIREIKLRVSDPKILNELSGVVLGLSGRRDSPPIESSPPRDGPPGRE